MTKGQIKICETSPGIERGFCGKCGTSLTYGAKRPVDGNNWSEDTWFAATTLDNPAIASPQSHVYVSHRQPWIKLDDGLKTFEQF